MKSSKVNNALIDITTKYAQLRGILKSGGYPLLISKIGNYVYASEIYIVYSLTPDVREEIHSHKLQGLKFVGINALARPGDWEEPLRLAPLYEEFARSGEWGLIAAQNSEPVGWAWIKQGPYLESTGCGLVTIGEGSMVLRFFEVQPEVRGRGVGQAVLGEITYRLSTVRHDPVVALVAEGNMPSRRCFEKLGCEIEGTLKVRRCFRKKLITRLQVAVREG
ncbi:MAG: GNAT family N-acetyltransferase [Pyrinomonadaceae bacterium]